MSPPARACIKDGTNIIGGRTWTVVIIISIFTFTFAVTFTFAIFAATVILLDERIGKRVKRVALPLFPLLLILTAVIVTILMPMVHVVP
jgi:hypothetical protein